MEVIKTMAPGAPGTKRYTNQWGDRLVAVRYRKDTSNNTRLTTIEICVDQRPLCKEKSSTRKTVDDFIPVPIRIDSKKSSLRRLIKQNGAVWDADLRCWFLPNSMVKILNLANCVVTDVMTEVS